MMVVAEADNGRRAVELASEHNPDVIVMDVSMPDMNGIEATRQIFKINPDIKIIALSMRSEKQREVLQLIAEGRTHSDIADRLFISRKTVDSHRLNSMHKLNMDNIPALTKFAVKHGITSL